MNVGLIENRGGKGSDLFLVECAKRVEAGCYLRNHSIRRIHTTDA
jgi:hypothetical protein